MHTHAHRPPRQALPLLLLAALLALGGGASWAGLAPRPAAAVVPGKNGRIAATRTVGSDWRIVTMTAKGKKARQLTDGYVDLRPRWSPDGTTILFARDHDLWTVPAAGGAPINLTRSAAWEYEAAWSPDGTRIAYVRGVEVWTMRADGSDPRFLLRPGSGAPAFVDWSPDGRQLALNALSSGVIQVWTVDADGRNLTPLTGGTSNSWAPRWSPDGKRIAFERNGDVWSMRANGSDPRNLTNTSDARESEPAWSPDGTRVLFRILDAGFNCQGLAKIPAAGGKAKAVPKTAGTCLYYPDWQTKPKQGKGKAQSAGPAARADRAARPDGVAQLGRAAKHHHAKPDGHHKTAR